MALQLHHLRCKTIPSPRRFLHPFSSSASGGNAGNGDGDGEPPSSPPPPSYSLFSDIKERLKSPPTPPRRIPTDLPPPPPTLPPISRPSPPASLEEIRKHLAEFRLKSQSNPPASSSGSPPISFQELFKNNVLSRPQGESKPQHFSFDSIRESLRQFKVAPSEQTRSSGGSSNLKAFQESLKGRMGDGGDGGASSLLGKEGGLPDSIFGRELREKMGEREGEKKALKTEFVKMYGYDELGEKLRKLRPEESGKEGTGWFSLQELNERLAKLRELEEKETESRMGGVSFRDLRESLVRLKEADANKRANIQRMSILINLGGQVTPSFMLRPPQEHLLEKYLHPDHMSSAEKMKLELQRVRDEFKMSESDCGSARVQVALLTTKIKHLSEVLHKKDKHSRKGLHEMVQRRKKLLKYLRRTDWDSYCFVLSKLGLRDVPEYKTPDYKLQNKEKKSKSKKTGKSKSNRKKKQRAMSA